MKEKYSVNENINQMRSPCFDILDFLPIVRLCEKNRGMKAKTLRIHRI